MGQDSRKHNGGREASSCSLADAETSLGTMLWLGGVDVAVAGAVVVEQAGVDGAMWAVAPLQHIAGNDEFFCAEWTCL